MKCKFCEGIIWPWQSSGQYIFATDQLFLYGTRWRWHGKCLKNAKLVLGTLYWLI